jgi:NAD(P)-dependent dehydrogenase (short-subunit alcohol dehydrogenase family)
MTESSTPLEEGQRMTQPTTVDLTGKLAVVTGGGRGLGLAYATALARAGASVVVNDVDGAAAEEAVKGIRAAGGEAVAEAGPVGTAEVADRLPIATAWPTTVGREPETAGIPAPATPGA